MAKRFVVDFAERVVATYVEVFLGLLIASWASVPEVGALSVLETAAVAAIPTALAALKALVAKYRGNGESASLSTQV